MGRRLNGRKGIFLLTSMFCLATVRSGRQAATSSADTPLRRSGAPSVGRERQTHQDESGPPGDVVWMAACWCWSPPWWMVLVLWVSDLPENRTARGEVGWFVLINACFVVLYFFLPTSPMIPCTRAIFQPTRAILHPSGAGFGRLSAKLGRHALKF